MNSLDKLVRLLLAAALTLSPPRCPRSADTLRAGFSTERLARVDALLDWLRERRPHRRHRRAGAA